MVGRARRCRIFIDKKAPLFQRSIAVVTKFHIQVIFDRDRLGIDNPGRHLRRPVFRAFRYRCGRRAARRARSDVMCHSLKCCIAESALIIPALPMAS